MYVYTEKHINIHFYIISKILEIQYILWPTTEPSK